MSTMALPCRSWVSISSAGVSCQLDEGHGPDHTATIPATFSAMDTWSTNRAGPTTVTLTWHAPVIGRDMRVRAAEPTTTPEEDRRG